MKNGIVKRYKPILKLYSAGMSATVEETANGEFVRYEDYLHERETVKKLRRQLAKIKRRQERKNDLALYTSKTVEVGNAEVLETYSHLVYNAVLTNVNVVDGRAYGVIYNDRAGRFPDGWHVITSQVLDDYIEGGVRYIKTKNSLYKVI